MIGVLGGGQLGRMLALAGYELGERFLFVDPSPEAGAGHLAPLVVHGYDDDRALDRLAADCEVVTYEFERVPAAAARRLAARVPVHPNPAVLDVAQDRLTEKQLFDRIGLRTPRYAPASSRSELEAALDVTGLPAVIKTRRAGYDGKGQVVVRARSDVDRAWGRLDSAELLVEELLGFERELSVLGARAHSGEVVVYPPVENRHRNGILRASRAPAPRFDDRLASRAGGAVSRLLNELDYVGVLALELFEVDGELLGNELAPRVHNSGHWTIEGAVTSQFENHVRAITGRPLGSPRPLGHSAMVNLIGRIPDVDALLSVDGAHLHLYGKRPRAGRKLGHVTLVAGEPEELDERLARILALVE